VFCAGLVQVVTKNSSTTSLVPEQFVRLLHHCGMPLTDVDIVNCDGPVMQDLLESPHVRITHSPINMGILM
jgi:1-pyrroline-5-carboxylate dehydrogenase